MKTDSWKLKRAGKISVHILFVLYIVILLRITVFRAGFCFENLMENGTINLTLFESYIPLIKSSDWRRIIYLFIGNIIWFVPLGMYLICMSRIKKIWQIFLMGLLLSFVIETLQYIFGTGISEADDLILNSLGALIGGLCGKFYKKCNFFSK